MFFKFFYSEFFVGWIFLERNLEISEVVCFENVNCVRKKFLIYGKVK